MRWLITGGTGSLGHALARYLLADPANDRVVVFSRDEFKQAMMAQAFAQAGMADRLRFFLGDVRDTDRLELAMRGVDVVVHAAALKRVDAIAYNPSEVAQTNVMGTWNVCVAAIRAGVRRVVFISSDKAVAPTNIYGASKSLAEHLVVSANAYGAPAGTSFTVVRYGNVAGSRGSVIHLWRQAQRAGASLVITDPRMTRFWISLPEACELVASAAAAEQPGITLVPKLPSFKLLDLATAIAGEGRVLVGTRRAGGEKLHEQLLSEPELLHTVDRGAHYIVLPDPHPWCADDGHRGDDVALPADFNYSSGTNTAWLSVEDLRRRLVEVPEGA